MRKKLARLSFAVLTSQAKKPQSGYIENARDFVLRLKEVHEAIDEGACEALKKEIDELRMRAKTGDTK